MSMSINYYNRRRKKIIDQINDQAFDTRDLSAWIDKLFEDLQNSIDPKITINYLLPNHLSPQIRSAYQEGVIKSHELHEIVDDLCSQIESFVHSKVSNIHDTFQKFSKLTDLCEFHYGLHHKKIGEYERKIVQATVKILTPNNLSFKILLTILRVLFLGNITDFAEDITIIFKFPITPSKTEPQSQLEKLTFAKVSRDELQTFLTLDDKDDVVLYYAKNFIKNSILAYFYPHGNREPNTRITIDKLQIEIPPTKSLRIKQYKDEYVRLADMIRPDMTTGEYGRIIAQNNIEGFYAGSINIEGNLCYMIFDIDVSGFLRSFLSRNDLWLLILNIANALMLSARELGIEGVPLIKFSGSRGVHIVYRYEKDILSDKMRRLNLDNYFYHFPGLWDLLKKRNSPLQSATSFSRLIADAIATYTVFFRKIPLPESVNQLGRIHQKEIFTLSSFSTNELAILIDTSPCSKGVFRTAFSLHPGTGYASIPINNTKTGKICREYRDYNALLDDATPENIQQHIKMRDKTYKRYFQISDAAVIKKQDIETLMEPHKLLPVIAFILRFTRRYALERPIGSFFYWYEYYLVRYTFEYIQKLVLSDDKSADHLINKIGRITREASISTRTFIIDYTRQFFNNTIAYPIFRDRIKGLYHFEFFYRVSPAPITMENASRIEELLGDEQERTYFLKKFEHIFLIFLDIFSIASRNPERISSRQEKVIREHYRHMVEFQELKALIRKKVYLKNESQFAVRELLMFIIMYNILVEFIKKYFRFSKIKVKKPERLG